MTEKHVTEALKGLRIGANVSLREMARRLGISPNSYSHYENPDRFKDPYLPMQWAERFADALADSGVPREAVLALAGGGGAVSAESLDARVSKLPPAGQEKVRQYLADQEILHARSGQSSATDISAEDP